MGKRAEYLHQADECRKMADRAHALDAKERWLTLSAKWLGLIEQIGGEVVELAAVPRQESSGS